MILFFFLDMTIIFIPIVRLTNLFFCIEIATDSEEEFVAGPLGAFASVVLPFVYLDGRDTSVSRSRVIKSEVEKEFMSQTTHEPLAGTSIRLSAPGVLPRSIDLVTSSAGTASISLEVFLPAENEVSLLRDVQLEVEVGDARQVVTVSVIELRAVMESRARRWARCVTFALALSVVLHASIMRPPISCD